jgi:hypothetical protein
MLVALVAASFPLCFLLASDTCSPSAVWAYIYAVFSHTSHFILKMEAAWTSEMLVAYTVSQPRRPQLEIVRLFHKNVYNI